MNKKILDLIYHSIIAEGSDGDAIWLSKYTTINDLIPIIQEYDIKNNTGWEIVEEINHITWGTDQEGAVITNDKNIFDSSQVWIILKINY